MKVGYVRVSAKDQDETSQIMAMEKLNLDRLFIDKKSGSTTKGREKFKEMLSFVREGDEVHIYNVNRWARNTLDALIALETIHNQGATLVCLDLKVDTRTPEGKMVFSVLSAVSEMLLADLKRTQRGGIEKARKQGKHLGRPWRETPQDFLKIYNAWKANKITAVQAFKALRLSKSVFYQMVKAHEMGVNRKTIPRKITIQ